MEFPQRIKRPRAEEHAIYPVEKKIKVDLELPIPLDMPTPDMIQLPSPAPSASSPPSSTHYPATMTMDTRVLSKFSITTKRNIEYDHVNQLLHSVHVHRYGDPEARESWWQEQQQPHDVMDMDPTTTYDDINTTLRQAFLQRHRHP